MSEFIREVDEEYRQEQIRGLLGRYWIALLALAVAVLMAVGGWRGYVYYRQQQAEAAGSRYFDAAQLFRDDRTGSLAALDALAKDGPAGYRVLARFRSATEVGLNDPGAGAKAFDVIAGDETIAPDLRDIAKLRGALLTMGSADPAEIRRRFEPLADSNAPFRNIAREMLAVAALKRGDDAEAQKRLDAVMSDPLAAQDQRERAGLFLSLIKSGKPGEAPADPVIVPPAETAVPPPAAPAPDAAATAPPAVDRPPVVTP